jgi:hypothetical protein
MNKITEFLNQHPTVRSMIRVFVYSFLAVFVPSLLGWFADVQSWASSDDMVFPAVEPLAKAAGAAVAAAIASILSGIWNKLPVTRTAEYPALPADG